MSISMVKLLFNYFSVVLSIWFYLYNFIVIALLLCFNFNQYIFLYVLFPNFPTVTNILKKTKIKKKELGWGQ